MKHNLKNRPKEWISVLENGGYSKHYIKTEKWFEEFQKELREWLTNIGKYSFTACALKEILGE